MDFIEGIGQSYLTRKANQAPYQAENLIKKQFAGNKHTEQSAAKNSAPFDSGRGRAASEAPSKSASGQKAKESDAEIARLRKELAAYQLSQDENRHKKESVVSGKSSVGPTKSTSGNVSQTKKSNASGPRLEKGGISKPRHRSESPKRNSKIAKGAAKLVALDGQVEKGGISTRKKDKAFAEVDEAYADHHPRRSRRRSSLSPAEPVYIERSPSRASGEGKARKTSRAASVAFSHTDSRSRGPPSEVSTLRGRDGRRGSPGLESVHSQHPSQSKSAPIEIIEVRSTSGRGRSPDVPSAHASHSKGPPSQAGTVRSSRTNHSSYADLDTTRSQHGSAPRHPSNAGSALSHHSHSRRPSSHVDPLDSDSDDMESEHGGSVALLHQRQNYRRRSSLGAVPEIPPVEKRPECVGPGFRPGREQEVGIVEVYQEREGRAPRARELTRRHEHEGYRGRGGGDSVVEVGHRGAKTLYKVR